MSVDKLNLLGSEYMFEKIRERLTFWLSTLALLNAAAFSGFIMGQTELEEVVVTARKLSLIHI